MRRRRTIRVPKAWVGAIVPVSTIRSEYSWSFLCMYSSAEMPRKEGRKEKKKRPSQTTALAVMGGAQDGVDSHPSLATEMFILFNFQFSVGFSVFFDFRFSCGGSVFFSTVFRHSFFACFDFVWYGEMAGFV